MEIVKIVKLDLNNLINKTVEETKHRNYQNNLDINRRKKDLIKVAGTLVLGLIDIHINLKKTKGIIYSELIEELLNEQGEEQAFEILLDKKVTIIEGTGSVRFVIMGIKLWHIENKGSFKATNSTIQTYYETEYGLTVEQILHKIIKEKF